MSDARLAPAIQRRNARLGVAIVAASVGMLAMSFAAVPLYDLFCAATGYGGTTQVATAAPGELGTRKLRVRFDANVRGGLPLRFEGEVASIQLLPGETKTVFYKATNLSDRPVTAVASYNVAPDAAGGWFSKISCFCFTDQTIPAGGSIDLPVVFFLDPGLEKDETMRGVSDVTLSYSFFPSQTPAASRAKPAGEGQG